MTDNLDLVQLMDQIKKDAATHKHNSDAPGFYRQLMTQGFDILLSPPASSIPPLTLQPELEKRDQYQLTDLLGYHDEAFVEGPYPIA